MAYYLEGDNAKPANATDGKKLIGKCVEYLRSEDIDKSGRGYIFPKTGVVTYQFKRNLEINGDLIPFANLKEVVILRDATEEEMEIYT